MTLPAVRPAYVLELRQRFTPLQNRYDLVRLDPSGLEQPLGYAEQKRFSLKERVTFWSGDDRRQVAFTIAARNVLELAATYDVQGATGEQLAVVGKDAVSSLLRSTYRLEVDGRRLLGRERSPVQAALRRVFGVLDLPWFLPIQFDVTEGDRVAMTIERQMKLRDVYRVEVLDGDLDWRVPAAFAVMVDAFMNR